MVRIVQLVEMYKKNWASTSPLSNPYWYPFLTFQVQLFVKILLGEIILPDTITMLREYDEELEEKAKRGLKRKHYHILGEGLEKYINDLTSLSNGTISIPRAVMDIFKHSGAERKKFNFKKYRNFVYTIVDDHHFEFYEREESQLWKVT